MISFELESNFKATDLLERAAQAALKQQSAPEGDITIVLTTNARLQKLNKEYLGIDAPTDVLSFPAHQTDPETGRLYIGDILISIPYAAQGAQAMGHSLEAEMQLLVVHGVLHLLGHDHAKAREKSRMWKAQSEILDALDLGQIQIRES